MKMNFIIVFWKAFAIRFWNQISYSEQPEQHIELLPINKRKILFTKNIKSTKDEKDHKNYNYAIVIIN